MEYGAESCYDDTLRLINRGHDFATTRRAIEMTVERGIGCGIHLILGLPGEDRNKILLETDIVNSLPINTLKLHQLQILKGSQMERHYDGSLPVPPEEAIMHFQLDEYIALVCDFLERLRPDIMMGVIRSSGETLVDASGRLIETPFHSNSGGQTANSEDVWRSALPYLRSVPDTFSYHMRQSDWTKVIPINQWLGYFSKTHKLNVQNDSIRKELLTFSQPKRKSKILGIPLTRIRTDFKLKSTFFSVSVDPHSGDVVLDGHGYGHGVGLSQEGTIRMVSLGISYDSIIRHYYTGSQIHRDENVSVAYVNNFVTEITKIIEEDKAHPGQKKSKKDDWLGKLFRVRDRQDREEEFDPTKQEVESDYKVEW